MLFVDFDMAAQAAAAGMVLITHGATKMTIPGGQSVRILVSSGNALLNKRKAIYGKAGLGTHWDEFDNEREVAWPTLLVRFNMSAQDGSFREALVGNVRPPLVAEQCAQLDVVALGGAWTRFPDYICSQGGWSLSGRCWRNCTSSGTSQSTRSYRRWRRESRQCLRRCGSW